MPDDMNTLFGELRGLLADTGESRADALWALLKRARALDPSVYDAAWRPYLADHADRLPAALWRVERWEELTPRAALLPPRLDLCLQPPPEDIQYERMGPRWDTPGLDAATSLRVYGDVEGYACTKLADRAPLPTLRRLDLSHNRLRTAGALRLLTSDVFPNLRALELRHSWLFGSQAAQLLEAPALLALEELSIGGEELPDALIAALPAFMERASALHTLRIAHRPVQSASSSALLDALAQAPPHITTIELELSAPYAEAMDLSRVAHTLADRPPLPALRRLSLDQGAWSGIAASALARWTGLASLRDLSLTHIAGPLEPLLSSPHLRELTALHIHDAGVSAASMAAIGEMAALTRLHANRCQLTHNQLLALRDSPALASLTSLALPGAELEGALALLDAPRLTYLDLSGVDLSGEQPADLPACPRAPLTHLSLGHTGASPALSAALGRMTLPTLTHLDLRGLSCARFVEALTPESLPALRHLCLDSYFVSDDDAALAMLCAPPDALPSLEALDLEGSGDREAHYLLLTSPLVARLRAINLGEVDIEEDWEQITRAIRDAGFTRREDTWHSKPRFV